MRPESGLLLDAPRSIVTLFIDQKAASETTTTALPLNIDIAPMWTMERISAAAVVEMKKIEKITAGRAGLALESH